MFKFLIPESFDSCDIIIFVKHKVGLAEIINPASLAEEENRIPRYCSLAKERNCIFRTIDSNATPIATLVDDVVTSQCFHADLTCNS